MKTMRAVVTGCSGYIGGQIVLNMLDRDIQVLGVDLRPHRLPAKFEFLQQDFSSVSALAEITRWKPDVIIHCAGTSLVGPSMANPRLYYHNNFVNTKTLLDHLLDHQQRPKIIFSSSASVYGEPIMTPCHEVDPCDPISPYGESKHMVEIMLSRYQQAYGLPTVCFRYFNACGADPQGRHGQESSATHVIARVLESLRDDLEFEIYGDDYATADGTCVRDFVHVNDIANAHVKACTDIDPGIYNLGTSQGHSVREIIALAESITGKTLRTKTVARRTGDPAVLTASDARFQQQSSDWRQHDVHSMISTAWAWYQH